MFIIIQLHYTTEFKLIIIELLYNLSLLVAISVLSGFIDNRWKRTTITGIGISEDVKTMIFGRFYQADNSLSRGYEGSGLGLAICRGLIELLGGSISAESTLGSGSIFRIELPLN